METVRPLDKFICAPYRQEVEVQHVDHPAGFSTLRLRIREIKRFTIFDIDAQTAEHWGKALLDWAHAQKKLEGEAK